MPRYHSRKSRPGVSGAAADLARLATRGGEGAIWTLDGSEDLNANLVCFEATEAEVIGEHVNDEVDVLFVGLRGAGTVRVEGDPHPLEAGCVVLAPKGSQRSISSETQSLAYLTVHRRRGPPRIGSKPDGNEVAGGGG